MQSRLIRLIPEVFLNGTVLSVSDKSDSVNKHPRDQRIDHILGALQNAHEFIGQLASWYSIFLVFLLVLGR